MRNIKGIKVFRSLSLDLGVSKTSSNEGKITEGNRERLAQGYKLSVIR